MADSFRQRMGDRIITERQFALALHVYQPARAPDPPSTVSI
jgi:hypothetical protein